MDDVFRTIEEESPAAVEALARLVRVPSVSAEGRGMLEAADCVEEQLRSLGAVTRRLGSPPVILGSINGSTGKRLLFYNHYDVQPVDPVAEWSGDPFELRREEGKLYGRGTADNKGDFVARIAAVRALQGARGGLPMGVTFVVEGDEEIGSPQLGGVVEDCGGELRAAGCIWESGNQTPTGAPVVTLGVKGLCYVQLECRGARRDLHSSQGTYIPNPAWRLVWALAGLKDLQERITIPGFADDIRGLTPAEREVLERIPTDDDSLLEELGIDGFLLGLRGTGRLLRHCGEPAANICGLSAGYTGPGLKTVLPATASAKLGFRLVPDQDPRDIVSKLERHLASTGFGDISVRLLSSEKPFRTSLDEPLARVAAETAREVYGCEPAINPSTGGTGPMDTLCGALDMPAVSVGVGYPFSGEHGPDEHIRARDFLAGTRHIALLVDRFAARLALADNLIG